MSMFMILALGVAALLMYCAYKNIKPTAFVKNLLSGVYSAKAS